MYAEHAKLYMPECDTDVAHYNFDADQPILIIFGRDVAETVCYQTVICYPTSPN